MEAPPGTPPKQRWECDECGWVGTWGQMDHVDTWLVCPACRAPEQWTALCDEPGCDEQVPCGWPSASGHRHTCGAHYKR